MPAAPAYQPDQAASASPNAGAVCFDGTPGGSHNFPLGLLSGLIPGRASVGSPGYPSLTTAILALDRIDFATGLHRLHYRRKSGASLSIQYSPSADAAQAEYDRWTALD